MPTANDHLNGEASLLWLVVRLHRADWITKLTTSIITDSSTPRQTRSDIDPPQDARWHALSAKQQRDSANEVRKQSAVLAPPGELRAGGKAAKRNSRIATDAPIPDNRKARRILAKFGTDDEIREFIDEYGYDCDVEGFICRYRSGKHNRAE